ncbi:MAG: DUF7002 family protein [Chromatiales bacterium]
MCHPVQVTLKIPAHAYHLAEAANWPSIQRHGLLSTSALLNRAGLPDRECARLERNHRPEHTGLPGGVYIRDQRPMPSEALARCLIGITPAEWYALLNSKVFFWFDTDRLGRQRRACGARSQVVLTVDTERLLARHTDRAALTPFNTGNARRRPARRGAATLVPYATWRVSGWDSEAAALGIRKRPRSHPPVELAIADAVPDICDFVVALQELGPHDLFRHRRA